MTTLTLKEQERSISNTKKKPIKCAAKIVLCSPFEKYWPLLDAKDASEMESLLSSILIREKDKVKIPWKKFLKLPKSLRKEKIKECTQKSLVSEELQLQRKCVKLGLNAVSRGIQNSKLDSCILAGDVQPDLILKPIITLAVTKNKPVIIFPKLRELTNNVIGFPCSGLAIELSSDACAGYKLLNDAVIDQWKKFPLPSTIVNHLNQNQDQTKKENKIMYNITDKSREHLNPADVYLYRTSNNVRAFQPPVIPTNAQKSFSLDMDFIPLDTSEKHQIYIPSNLKRSIKNTNRNNKKRKTNDS